MTKEQDKQSLSEGPSLVRRAKIEAYCKESPIQVLDYLASDFIINSVCGIVRPLGGNYVMSEVNGIDIDRTNVPQGLSASASICDLFVDQKPFSRKKFDKYDIRGNEELEIGFGECVAISLALSKMIDSGRFKGSAYQYCGQNLLDLSLGQMHMHYGLNLSKINEVQRLLEVSKGIFKIENPDIEILEKFLEKYRIHTEAESTKGLLKNIEKDWHGDYKGYSSGIYYGRVNQLEKRLKEIGRIGKRTGKEPEIFIPHKKIIATGALPGEDGFKQSPCECPHCVKNRK